ncbi:MAG: hypothetical protein OXB89_03835, partial [Anaerolineaceae bacterium]|nr:hypothetical protein [Anaerolineaceae bacterium]
MELKIFLLADYASIGNDKLNILGVVDRITADKFPLELPSLYLAIKFSTEQTSQDVSHEITILFLDDNDEEISKGGGEFTIPKTDSGQTTNVVVNFTVGVRNLVFGRPSSYECRLLVDDQVTGSIPFEVVQLEKTPQE